MNIEDLIERSPMQAVSTSIRGGLEIGQLGGILSAAGVGKSTFLIHVALNSLLRGSPVLHISLGDGQAHVRSYYDEILTALARATGEEIHPSIPLQIERNRVIHACLGRDFSPSELTRLLGMLSEVMDFRPTHVVIDDSPGTDLASWRETAAAHRLRIWLTVCTPDIAPSAEVFDTAVTLQPQGRDVVLRLRQNGGPTEEDSPLLLLDPVSMLVRPEDVRDPRTSPPSPDVSACTLFSGAATGSEAAFGENAQRWGIEEVNFSFEGHSPVRERGLKVLAPRELAAGAVSLLYVSHHLRRRWEQTALLRKVLQIQWHIVSNADQIFVVGRIHEGGTVHGGTGWAVELARRWNKRVWVFDQEVDQWVYWAGSAWKPGVPVIESPHFAGTGTRFLSDAGRNAIADLFDRSFGPAS